MYSLRNQKICLREFIPSKVIRKNSPEKSFELNRKDIENYIKLSYFTNLNNHTGLVGKKKYELLLPKYVRKNQETFEVLGLLQAEMGKKHDGKIVFCNHEYKLIRKVMKWFEIEFDLPKDAWKWYIKVNINEPFDENYKREVEYKVINYWISKIGLSLKGSYPKKVSYIKNTKNITLGFFDYGTLIIEIGSNLFSQILKNFVKNTFYSILQYQDNEIRWFMRGIIAGESNIEIHMQEKHYRVFISAKDFEERKIYQKCLKRLKIESTNYPNFVGLIISRKQNNLQLLKQQLMTLSPEKYNKFLRMINLYQEFEGLTEWRNNLQRPHNKIPLEKIDKIIELHNQHPDWSAWKIAEQVGVSDIKVQRILKEKNLGKRLVKTPESKRREIALFAKEHLELTQKEIAEIFNIHESIVRRVIHKYNIERGNVARCQITKEITDKIIEFYKLNPAIKISEITENLGVSDSVIRRVRRENNLTHLGYLHLIGNNNQKAKGKERQIEVIYQKL